MGYQMMRLSVWVHWRASVLYHFVMESSLVYFLISMLINLINFGDWAFFSINFGMYGISANDWCETFLILNAFLGALTCLSLCMFYFIIDISLFHILGCPGLTPVHTTPSSQPNPDRLGKSIIYIYIRKFYNFCDIWFQYGVWSNETCTLVTSVCQCSISFCSEVKSGLLSPLTLHELIQ